jgi:hypothetical protein
MAAPWLRWWRRLAGWNFVCITTSRHRPFEVNLIQADRQGALNLTTIDWQNADRDVQRILNGATGQFHDEFATRSQPFVDVIKQAKSTSVGTIAEAGLESEGSGRKCRRSTFRYSVCCITSAHRSPLSDTTFHFVNGDPATVLEQVREAAQGKDVRLGGGASTIRRFLDADLVDTLHVAVSPQVELVAPDRGCGSRLRSCSTGFTSRSRSAQAE